MARIDATPPALRWQEAPKTIYTKAGGGDALGRLYAERGRVCRAFGVNPGTHFDPRTALEAANSAVSD